jgi:hypothetical protein
MVGDAQDMLGRLRAVLPNRWFPDQAPILDAAIQGLAWGWAWAYGLLAYVRAQTRIATASDIWLDIVAEDFFGVSLARRTHESDDSLRGRIQLNLFRERATRAALSRVLVDLTGRSPIIFEPSRTTDTGGWGGASASVTGLGYGVAGGWGSLQLPFQCFVTAFRPSGSGIANVAGWSAPVGGYGVGAIQYAAQAMIEGQVPDSDIADAIAAVVPAASLAWMTISS